MKKHNTNRQPTVRRHGAVLVLFLVILPVLIVMVGFSIDFAQMQLARTELRRSTDLAAKAASLSLSITSSETDARQAAQEIGLENSVAGQPLQIADSNVEFGSSQQNGDGTVSFVPGGWPTNAVRVIGDRSIGSLDGPVNTYFGALYNSETFEPRFAATGAFENADICLVLDRSGSMKLAATDPDSGMTSANPRMCEVPRADSRWHSLHQAVNEFVGVMERTASVEQVGVVTFASDMTACGVTTQRVAVDQALTGDLYRVRTAIDDRTNSVWNGMTDIAAGIEEAQVVLTGPQARSTASKVMIVMTDGRYTEDNPVPFAQIAQANGITVHTITFSVGANQADMQAVATAGNGNHYHADSTADLISVFRDLAGSVSGLIE